MRASFLKANIPAFLSGRDNSYLEGRQIADGITRVYLRGCPWWLPLDVEPVEGEYDIDPEILNKQDEMEDSIRTVSTARFREFFFSQSFQMIRNYYEHVYARESICRRIARFEKTYNKKFCTVVDHPGELAVPLPAGGGRGEGEDLSDDYLAIRPLIVDYQRAFREEFCIVDHSGRPKHIVGNWNNVPRA